MAEIKQIGITLPSGKEVHGNVVTAFQDTDKNYLISYLDDPNVPQPEGMVNLSVSLLNGNSVTGIEKTDAVTWGPLTDHMRGIITGNSYPSSYVNEVPSTLSATAELYARNIAVTPDQKDILQRDYMTKTEVKVEAVVAPTPAPIQEQTVVGDVAPVMETTSEMEVPVTPVVEAPATPVSVFNTAPDVEEPVAIPTPEAQVAIEEPQPVEVNATQPNVNLAQMKETFMNSVSALFDQTFAELSNKEAQVDKMQQELNTKIAEANQMLAAAEEAKKDAEAKAAVATVAFNNAQSLKEMPSQEEAVQLPTPEGPVLTIQ